MCLQGSGDVWKSLEVDGASTESAEAKPASLANDNSPSTSSAIEQPPRCRRS